ncbi:MAG: Nramp family divalent metal transporter [Candidatus Komeilibacteria bacterium]
MVENSREEKRKHFPEVLPLRKLMGPSFLMLALGFGSGEVILWPYLSSNYGLGIAWGALLGITFQFFINMEIERYALAKGESVFVGIHRLFPWSVYWFIVSTFVGFGLPGIIAASAQVLSSLFGLGDFRWLAALMLIAIGLIVSLGKTVYDTLEHLTRWIIAIAIPFIIFLAFFLTSWSDWQQLFAGLIGQGDGYRWLPSGISMVAFFAAFAYSGAGGNLNLAQSIYIREKGYGMGIHAQKIGSLFHRRQQQEVRLEGHDFIATEDNQRKFNQWWRKINVEHGIIFWFLGWLAIALLMVLAHATTHGLPGNTEGIKFVINEGLIMSGQMGRMAGTAFLLIVSVMLFQTQLGVTDSTSRIMAENVALRLLKRGQKTINLAQIYFFFVWAQIIFGIVLFTFNIAEPRLLIISGAIINAVAMFVHIGLVNWTNFRLLPRSVQPKLWRRIIMLIIFLFFGFFSALTLSQYWPW